ncbi:hypothetical protein K466DRAFT_59868 [Polyporus arcularius HHB13444]|uniref:Uncharacterized protein n=1 Tax=Polyporus arcularius HHB13444 TaxID=1314778 RepID=A0A5C3PWH1_9APHY|nr:hypothetical protein K466DRAFT_59868 [Polyporus arcularius HHB13444]
MLRADSALAASPPRLGKGRKCPARGWRGDDQDEHGQVLNLSAYGRLPRRYVDVPRATVGLKPVVARRLTRLQLSTSFLSLCPVVSAFGVLPGAAAMEELRAVLSWR